MNKNPTYSRTFLSKGNYFDVAKNVISLTTIESF